MALRPSLGWGAAQGGAPGYDRLRRLRAFQGGGDLVGGAACVRVHQQTIEAVPRGRAWPPSPGRHLVASSAAIAHLREVGRSQRRDCISTATWLHSVCSDSVTNMY